MIRRIAILYALLVANAAITAIAYADSIVDVKYNNLGRDRTLILDFLTQDEFYKASFDPTGKMARAEPGLYFSLIDVWVGRYDLDGDGVQEVILSISWTGYCGSIGCPFIVLKREGKKLRPIAGVTGTGFVVAERPLKVQIPGPPNDPGCNYTTALVPPRHSGVKTFHAYHTGAYWNGQEFRSFCISRCCE